ncbi:MAG TPA: dihydroorotate dehydrogenase electron transfer subunit [Candidatus Paceibacterota bacterium]|nr:dihydroorotate dehydrogenase electron transfer subunit [Candidatus Paceibacterota bacterium]
MSRINRHAKAVNATVMGNKRIGQYHQILLNVGELVTHCRPGNFVAIAVGGENSGLILRRAFAISRISHRGDYGGTMELIIAPRGAGSRWLCEQTEGVELEIIAPLGSAFGIPTEPVQALLIGGGYGSAPLFGLAEVLKSRGCRVDMILGASSAAKIYAPTEGKRSVNSLKIYTEDGSAGILGKVTDPLENLINEGVVDVIYSCGPMGMLSAISGIAANSDVVHQCAVEESMACGIGVCMTCVLPIENSDESISMLRSCIDGPVMDGAAVRWDLVGKVTN